MRLFHALVDFPGDAFDRLGRIAALSQLDGKERQPFQDLQFPCLSLYQHVESPSPVSPSFPFCAHIAL